MNNVAKWAMLIEGPVFRWTKTSENAESTCYGFARRVCRPLSNFKIILCVDGEKKPFHYEVYCCGELVHNSNRFSSADEATKDAESGFERVRVASAGQFEDDELPPELT